MTSKTTWKGFEAWIAGLFDTTRNPLSGANNRNDDGSNRLGDIIYRNAVVEAKVRKSIASITRALKTRKESEEAGVPFIHFERVNGDKKNILLVVDVDTVEKIIVPALRAEWEDC